MKPFRFARIKRNTLTIVSCICLFTYVSAQEQTEQGLAERIEALEQQHEASDKAIRKLQHLKISGYVQAQYQWGEEAASLKVGASNENKEKAFNRIGIRRGRIKIAYEEKIASGVFQLDITEKGVGFKDAYLSIRAPWTAVVALKAGVFDRPFGHEIGYSSSRRESPERSTIFQTLFPEERDLGAMITLQPSETSPFHFLKLEAGLFAGNGIKQETDNRKDFIGHLSASKDLNNCQISGGLSYYNGGVYQGTHKVYKMEGHSFVLNDEAKNTGQFAKREYIGLDCQFNVRTSIGQTQLRSEYLFGTQPGTDSGSNSPNASSRPAHDTYIRHFNGGYVTWVQYAGQLPLAAVLKYDWYDPNTQISGNDIGQNHTHEGDIAQHTFGFGLLWNITPYLRLQTYYDIHKNEKTTNLTAYQNDRNDNVFTLRMQYKF